MSHSDFPSFSCYHKLEGINDNVHEAHAWQDVQFYPYTHPSVDPVFAVTGTNRNTAVYRCVRNADREPSIELVRTFGDRSEGRVTPNGPELNSLEWTHDDDGNPLLCVAGKDPRIKVLNVISGEVVMNLAGHGQLVTELVISPTDHTMLASASYDRAVRLWTLDPKYKKQRTVAILAGDGGHKFNIVALEWHRNGRYLISGGMDTMVNIWMIPEKEELKKYLGSDKPLLITYPHFSSTDIHHEYVDCIKFYNDLIISRAAQEDTILLWKIDNFTSNEPPPHPAPLPHSPVVQSRTPVSVPVTPFSGTRSAWGGKFQRLLQFEYPQSDPFYMRFSLLHELGMRPLLAAGDTESRVSFWDLQLLEESGLGENVPRVGRKKKKINNKVRAPRGLAATIADKRISRAASHPSESSVTTDPSDPAHSETSKETESSMDDDLGAAAEIGDPYSSIPPHKIVRVPAVTGIPKKGFSIRGTAWSRNGEWFVACGDYGMIGVMTRWGSGRPE